MDAEEQRQPNKRPNKASIKLETFISWFCLSGIYTTACVDSVAPIPIEPKLHSSFRTVQRPILRSSLSLVLYLLR